MRAFALGGRPRFLFLASGGKGVGEGVEGSEDEDEDAQGEAGYGPLILRTVLPDCALHLLLFSSFAASVVTSSGFSPEGILEGTTGSPRREDGL
jgi:hypothetical protein